MVNAHCHFQVNLLTLPLIFNTVAVKNDFRTTLAVPSVTSLRFADVEIPTHVPSTESSLFKYNNDFDSEL